MFAKSDNSPEQEKTPLPIENNDRRKGGRAAIDI